MSDFHYTTPTGESIPEGISLGVIHYTQAVGVFHHAETLRKAYIEEHEGHSLQLQGIAYVAHSLRPQAAEWGKKAPEGEKAYTTKVWETTYGLKPTQADVLWENALMVIRYTPWGDIDSPEGLLGVFSQLGISTQAALVREITPDVKKAQKELGALARSMERVGFTTEAIVTQIEDAPLGAYPEGIRRQARVKAIRKVRDAAAKAERAERERAERAAA